MLDLESEVQWFKTHSGNILLLEFLFSRNKASDANIGIIAILVHFEKTLGKFEYHLRLRTSLVLVLNGTAKTK